MLKICEKEEILKVTTEKDIMYRKVKIKIISDFLYKTTQARKQ